MSNVVLFALPTPDNTSVADTLEEVVNTLPSEIVVVGIADGKFFFKTSNNESALNLLLVAVKKLTDIMERELS